MTTISGTERGQRKLNGIQTSGRDYRDLSAPTHGTIFRPNLRIPTRDGETLLCDVLLPEGQGRFPAIVAFSPYPRQLQNSGAPFGFIEAGQSDFFVPRGYAHVLVNARGSGGSGGTFSLADEQERRDLYDIIEWVAAQPWCDGNVGMIGISYFGGAQLSAAAAKPPHLRAIFPFAATADYYRGAVWHGGILSSRFVAGWIAGLGVLASRGADAFRGPLTKLASAVLRSEPVHRRFEDFNGEAAIAALGKVMRVPYDPHPWDDIYNSAVIDHPLYDDFWKDRQVLSRLADVDIPIYLGCDWDNVALHLPSTFWVWEQIAKNPNARMTILPRGGLCWPWESMHVEALAWFDRWLKGRDTGIDRGDPIRYWVHGAEEWRTSKTWPIEGHEHKSFHLRADAALAPEAGPAGSREYMHVPPTLSRPPNANPPPLPPRLDWQSAPLTAPLDVVGPISVELDAVATAGDVDWIVKLQDIAPDGTARDLTQGWLRGSHRALDPERSRPGAPYHAHERLEAVTPGAVTSYSIAVIPTAHRFLPGHRLGLALASQDGDGMAMLGFEHAGLSLPSRNTVLSSSRVSLPVSIKGTR
jgi:hypothetical protein